MLGNRGRAKIASVLVGRKLSAKSVLVSRGLPVSRGVATNRLRSGLSLLNTSILSGAVETLLSSDLGPVGRGSSRDYCSPVLAGTLYPVSFAGAVSRIRGGVENLSP